MNASYSNPSTPPGELARFIDHTLLKPETTAPDIERLCTEAIQHQFLTVCVNSVYIPLAVRLLSTSRILPIAVVGFPLGACGSQSKCFETELAIRQGAREIDMVLWTGALKAGENALALQDIREVVRACAGVPLKVIIETALLDREQKIRACQLALEAGAQFVKTCTGFLGGGATVEDIQLMRSVVGSQMGVKASGGIRDYETACALLDAGANRLGTSNGVAIVNGASSTTGY